VFFRPSQISPVDKNEILARLWVKDASLWADAPDQQDHVRRRLGWLDILPLMRPALDEILGFAREVKARGMERVVILGMGGSSLCSLVLSQVFPPREGCPRLVVLDTTDPDEVERVAEEGQWATTLFVVASKSGTTMEPDAQFRYFWPLVSAAVADPGVHFCAITDPETSLERLARDRGFCKVFLNPSDVGGRYSALSYFGLVPAALLGLDLERILTSAEKMAARCGPDVPWDENPGCLLGTFLGEFSLQNRDKFTLLADPPMRPFGLWLEQLLAESTGKDTRGIVPIFGETTGIPGFYGGERIFAYLRVKGTAWEDSFDQFVSELRQADFPVYELWVDDPYDLGGQFFLWEFATALASHFLAVNPFDEPDVEAAKARTRAVIETYRAEGQMPAKFWVDPQSQIHFRPSEMLASSLKGLSRAIRDIFQVLPTWGYFAFLPYLPYVPEVEEILAEMRHLARQEKGCATTLGYGPRYLHSTGQLHKGGPLSAAFLLFTRRRARQYPSIDGLDLTFWDIQFAQALGDFQALSEGRKRVIHVHLPEDYLLGLRSFSKVFSRAVRI